MGGLEGFEPSLNEFGFVNISILSGLYHFHSISTLGTRRQVSTPSVFLQLGSVLPTISSLGFTDFDAIQYRISSIRHFY